MQDERTTPGSDDATREDDPADKYDDAVMAADATGMLAGEKLITDVEIEEGLAGKDLLAGDV
ncbi:MAG TPA: hypothetical protein VGX96_05190 [Candidatus Elarobacter sp.]|jgi:hypothetical protein|nr:hypothetical protein [Candidatus Elarobacter sp.]